MRKRQNRQGVIKMGETANVAKSVLDAVQDNAVKCASIVESTPVPMPIQQMINMRRSAIGLISSIDRGLHHAGFDINRLKKIE